MKPCFLLYGYIPNGVVLRMWIQTLKPLMKSRKVHPKVFKADRRYHLWFTLLLPRSRYVIIRLLFTRGRGSRMDTVLSPDPPPCSCPAQVQALQTIVKAYLQRVD
eukprot:8424265-Pyramimonas_sp.AAC.1